MEASFDSEPWVYRAGCACCERFNHAVFGPAFPRTDLSRPWAGRTGDIIAVNLPLFTDGCGNAGLSVVDTGRTQLFGNGHKVGETPVAGGGEFEVPPDAGDYRLTSAVRPGSFEVTTAVSATWTLRSGHVQQTQVQPLPLSAVRYIPRLEGSNTAPAGTAYVVPVLLATAVWQSAAGAAVGCRCIGRTRWPRSRRYTFAQAECLPACRYRMPGLGGAAHRYGAASLIVKPIRFC